jgi:hypothetical protein
MIPALAFALFQAAAPAPPPAPPASGPATISWAVSPESVTVAEAFTVSIIVRAPRGVLVVFPPGPDSTQTTEALDPPAISESQDSAGVSERRAFYRLVAWETGRLTVPLAPIVVGTGPGAQRLQPQPIINVRSVLPVDTALRKPRPALGVILASTAWWPYAAGALLLLVLLALLWRRHRRRRRTAEPPPTPLATAERALAHIETLGLIEAGEPSRYVALHADVLRGYLSARAPVVSRAQTTAELVQALFGRALPLERVQAVLAEVDIVQFAKKPVTVVRAKEIAREIKAIIAASDEAFSRDVGAPGAPGAPAPPKQAA